MNAFSGKEVKFSVSKRRPIANQIGGDEKPSLGTIVKVGREAVRRRLTLVWERSVRASDRFPSKLIGGTACTLLLRAVLDLK